MKNTNGLLKVLLVALAIPAIGFAVSFFIINDMNKGLQAEGTWVQGLSIKYFRYLDASVLGVINHCRRFLK